MDPESSDATRIESLTDENNINLKYANEGTYDEFEDFNGEGIGAWGFMEGAGGTVKVINDGELGMFLNAGIKTTASDVKTMSEDISSAKNIILRFDWKNDVGANTGRGSSFQICDSEDNAIFSIIASTNKNAADAVQYAIEGGTAVTVTDGSANDWHRVELTFDFIGKKLTGKITNLSTGNAMEIPETVIEAENLVKIKTVYGYSLAPQRLDNFGVIYNVSE